MTVEVGFVIQVTRGDELLSHTPLPVGVSRVGAADEALIKVRGGSRALLTLSGSGRLLVNDLGGTPEVLVRGKRAVDAPLRVGEVVEVGDLVLTLRDTDELAREAEQAEAEARERAALEQAEQERAAREAAEAAASAAEADRREKARSRHLAAYHAEEAAAATAVAAVEAVEPPRAEPEPEPIPPGRWSFLPVAWARWVAKGALLGAWVSALIAVDVLKLPPSEAADWLGMSPAIWSGMLYMGTIGLGVQVLAVWLLMPRWSAEQWRKVRTTSLLPFDLLVSFGADLVLILAFSVVLFLASVTIGWVFYAFDAVDTFDRGAAYVAWGCVGLSGLIFAAINIALMWPEGGLKAPRTRLGIRLPDLALEYVIAAALIPLATKALLTPSGPAILDWIVVGLGAVALIALLPTAAAAGAAGAGGTFVWFTTQALTASVTLVTASVGTLGALGFAAGSFFVMVFGVIFVFGVGSFITQTFGPGIESALAASMAVCGGAYCVCLIPLGIGSLAWTRSAAIRRLIVLLTASALGGGLWLAQS